MKTLLLSVILSVFLIGCAATSPSVAMPASAPGMALMRGRLLTPQGSPLTNRSVRLAGVYEKNGAMAYVVDDAGGIGGVTDTAGNFAIGNIPPGEYVVVVVEGEGLYAALLDRDGTERVFTLQANNMTDIGTISLSLNR